MTLATFKNGLPLEAREYNEKGQIIELAVFHEGQITIYKEFYDNGNVEEEIDLKKNTIRTFDESGKLIEEEDMDELALAITSGFLQIFSFHCLWYNQCTC